MRRSLSFFCVIVMIVCCFTVTPAFAVADEAPAPDDLFQLGSGSGSGDVSITDVETEDYGISTVTLNGIMTMSLLPSSYDPRESGDVTAVRDQGTWNTCWAVASIAAAEMDGLTNGLLTTSVADTDLSERHLIYFMTHQVDDPLGNSSGDYNTDMSYWLTAGGNPVLATMTLASWHGAAAEDATGSAYSGMSGNDQLDEAYAYTDVLHLEDTYCLDISTAAGQNVLKEMIQEHGGAVLCLYYDGDHLYTGVPTGSQEDTVEESEDDVTADGTAVSSQTQDPEEDLASEILDDDEAVTGPTEVPEATEAPEAAEASAPTEVPEVTAVPTAASETQYDVALDGLADDSDDAQDDGTADGDYVVCYYQDISSNTNHEVIIVGWDDDYPAEYFGLSDAGAVPPGDGAWLCRNSYGDGWAGGDGYFWVSYYDQSITYPSGGNISTARVTVFSFGSANDYDNNYEYDGAAVLGYVNDSIDGKGVSTLNASSSTRRWYANVFTASACPDGAEVLEAVSTYTYRANVPYTVEVYVDLQDASDPTSGALAATEEGTFTYAGFHTVSLSAPVDLEEGETYAVIFKVAMADDSSVFVPACYTLSSWRSVNDSDAGQSFVSLDGSTWLDCYELKNSPNVRIKAYTVDVERTGDTLGSDDDDNGDTTDDSTDGGSDADAPSLPFTDVSENAWYYESVCDVWRLGLMEGISADQFDPTSSATRAAVVMVLYRMAGEPEVTTSPDFTDVSTTAWYAQAVAWAQEEQVVSGYPDGTFRPNKAVTRQEFVTMLYRYASVAGAVSDDYSSSTDLLSGFIDQENVSSWAMTAETWSVATGLQVGSMGSDGSLSLAPAKGIARSELATFLSRYAALMA